MEIISVVCLLALYKFLDSSSPAEAIAIETYHGTVGELEQ